MKTRINIANYEEYLLDYLEGTLDESLRREVEAFLDAHPLIRKELEGLEEVRLEAEPLSYPNPHRLHRSEAILEEATAMLLSAAADDTLSLQEQVRLNAMLKEDAHLRKEHHAYLATRLSPDLTVTYPDKAGLRKAVPLFAALPLRQMMRYAAAIAFLVASVWVVIRPGSMEMRSPHQLAQISVAGSGSLPDAVAQSDARHLHPMALVRQTPVTTVPVKSKGGKAGPAKGKSETKSKGRPRESWISPMPSLPMASNHMTTLRVTDRPPLSLAPYLNYRSLQWITDDPLLAEQQAEPTHEVLYRGSLAGLFRREPSRERRQQDVRRVNLWGVAEAGITAFNVLTDNKVELQKDLDDQGNVVAYALLSDGVEVSRKKKFD